ncbi:hypothetical protein BMS3Abin05_01123 [bacterium BMS3Abin05]|nr:hypothetical protein BMS3Abin05_01123 [bacterium BMS3Abin05]GBE27880.1 hypothetical protein BMS3Bbin03_01811 [bacterium BMS3Bbin03]
MLFNTIIKGGAFKPGTARFRLKNIYKKNKDFVRTVLKFRRLWVVWSLLFAGLLFLTPTHAVSSDNAGLEVQKIRASYSNLLVQQAAMNKTVLLKESADRRRSQLEKKIQDVQFDKILQKKVDEEIPAGEKINAFLRAIKMQEAHGLDRREIFAAIRSQFRAKAVQGSGVIQGSVTVDGVVPPQGVEVMVFDRYGFPAGSAELDWNGAYSVTGLAPGQYFVLTSSQFVDEFYDNAISDDYAGWRNAKLVPVKDGETVTGIDFDLQAGAVITGNVFKKDGLTPIAWNLVQVKIFRADQKKEITKANVFTDDQGAYSVNVPGTGSFKIYAESWGYEGEFYNQKSSWNDADVVTISSLNDTLKGIDFSLVKGESPGTNPVAKGGAIQGKVTGAAGIPLNFTFMVAFNTADTSLAGFAVTSQALFGGEVAPGEYVISPLDSGSYIVYANDLIGPYGKEYYDGSLTPDGAKPVLVSAEDTTRGIDFSMRLGGSISGSVTMQNSAPMDSILVIAVRKDIMDEDKFFSNIDFGFAFTDSTGVYTIRGLSSGDYVLRTISLTNSAYSGRVLDEWYENAHSIWDWRDATPVTVTAPGSAGPVNFVLESPGFISGKVTNSDGSIPVGGVYLLALRASDNLPELAYGVSGSGDGSYLLGPLPDGNYKVFAFIELKNEAGYLPEFYNGARTIEAAADVPVTIPGTTPDINFTLDKGGTIQGFVYLAPGFSAGADSLKDIPVIAYDVNTGVAISAQNSSFSGGFRMSHLPPGRYKLCVLPVIAPFAVTYYGGGAVFDDPNSKPITVAEAGVVDADVTLGQGSDTIAGNVYALEKGVQSDLPMTMVMAYDSTGHVVSAGVTGFDIVHDTELPDKSGYFINGLRPGNYGVRTFSTFSFLMQLSDMEDQSGGSGPGSGGVPGIGGENGGLPQLPFFGNLNFNFKLYRDEWYDDVPVKLSAGPSMMSLIWSLLTDPDQVMALFPFFSIPEEGAASVASNSTGINFVLEELNIKETVSNVTVSGTHVPSKFVLEQNYPNPVRLNAHPASGTTIRYSIPKNARVEITVYNILGQKVATLINQNQLAGVHSAQWNGMDQTGNLVSNGIYFYELKAGNRTLSLKKMVVLR